MKTFNGPAILAAMLREVDPVFRGQLYEKIKSISPILAKLIDKLEFNFSDLIRLEDQSCQKMLSTIPEQQWLTAWKLTPKHLQDKILQNMSERRRQDFLAAVKTLPRIHKGAVYAAQLHIALHAKTLLQNGKLKMKSRVAMRRNHKSQ